MDKYLSILLFALAGQIAFAPPLAATQNDKAPFDPSKGLKDYAGETIIGSKSSATGRSDSVIAGEHAAKCAELQLRNCTGLQVQVYPSFQGSWPDAAPEILEKITFKTEGLSALVNWGRDHQQKTLHHLMIGPNQYFPQWFRKNEYTAAELDQLLKRYITTLMTVNDNKRKMDGWNIFNEMLVGKEESGEYKKDGSERVYITELDVSMGMGWKKADPFPEGYEKRQAERFYGLVKAAREAGVHRIDVWGLSEAVNQHWLVGQKARLFDEQFKPRPTYQAVLKALYDTYK